MMNRTGESKYYILGVIQLKLKNKLMQPPLEDIND
jgi:hypothetical protein